MIELWFLLHAQLELEARWLASLRRAAAVYRCQRELNDAKQRMQTRLSEEMRAEMLKGKA